MQITFDAANPESVLEELNAFFGNPNAAPCYEKLERILSSGSKNKGAVIKLYLENFKTFNETFGYQFGEMFLREIARFLCGIEGADVYRPAGVEFIVIMDGCRPAAAVKVLENIAARFESTWHINSLDCMCSVNLAAVYYPGHAESRDKLLDQLSYAISVAAMQGPNRYCVFDEALHKNLYRHNSIARLIPNAIDTGLLELRYLPTFHIKSRRFTCANSYLRLISPEFGMINAAELIPIAEETGQIYLISHYAVTKACELISRLLKEGVEFEKIAIPISPVQILQERFVDDVKKAITLSGIPAKHLAFEVNEDIALSGFSSSQSHMDELSEMGIEIILTDFGSGGSGLNNILNMSVDAVKLERLLIWQMSNVPNAAAIVAGLVYIARNLKLKTIAGGVETKQQMELLEKFGCDYLQGFFFSRTLTADELIVALQRTDF